MVNDSWSGGRTCRIQIETKQAGFRPLSLSEPGERTWSDCHDIFIYVASVAHLPFFILSILPLLSLNNVRVDWESRQKAFRTAPREIRT